MDINKKIAVVTGANSGLGAAASKSLIKKGALVYGLSRNLEKLKILQRKLGENFKPISLDITDEEKLKYWVNHT
ncbi:MAG TPA: SDR family NAD(P)-dependent oxidoreductase, partial [Flavobacteriaceae bacterium]|nr:SDR family NAD(P)-dependent oxidoreductase [Flavobacteriaceae bacterium]